MHNFQAFESNEKLSIPSYFNLPRDLLEQEYYSSLSPDAILLYGIFLDRLAVSYLHNNDKIHFFDEDGKMYIIFKRDEIMKKMHIKRTKLDFAIKLLESCNLIKQVQQGRNLPNIIYVGKTKSMIESAKIINIGTAEKQQSRMQILNNPECRKTTSQYNYNNINNHNKNYRADNRFYDESNQYNNLEKYLKARVFYFFQDKRYYTIESPYFSRHIRLERAFGEDYSRYGIEDRIYDENKSQEARVPISMKYAGKKYSGPKIDKIRLKFSPFYRRYVKLKKASNPEEKLSIKNENINRDDRAS